MTSTQNTNDPKPAFGFEGANWAHYQQARPSYPPSFFRRIYDYHGEKKGTTWSTAHDVGAGCGIVAAQLISKFDHVIVSDPNDGYTELARKLLVQDSGNPASKFTFVQASAEHNGAVASGTVDAITACEMMHFPETAPTVREFARQLKPGGTLAITFYGMPRVLSSKRADEAWNKLLQDWARSTRVKLALFATSTRHGNMGYDTIEIPEADWEDVKRVYINARGRDGQWLWAGDAGTGDEGALGSKVKDTEEIIRVEEDEDWMGMKSFSWFQDYLSSVLPKLSPHPGIEQHWAELEKVLGGEKVKVDFPVIMILATKR